MAMEKSLYSAPQGIDQELDEPDLEIEIEDPESVSIGIDGLQIDIEPEEELDGDAMYDAMIDDLVASR